MEKTSKEHLTDVINDLVNNQDADVKATFREVVQQKTKEIISKLKTPQK